MESEDMFHLNGRSGGGFYDVNLAGMRTRGDLCDVIIQTGDRSFQAHRRILAAASPFLRTKFTKNNAGSRKKEVNLEECDSQSVGYIIDFIYCKNVSIPSSNVTRVLKTALYLQMDEVVNECFEFLLRTDIPNNILSIVIPDNILSIRQYAEAANKTDIMENVDRYVRHNFEDVSKCEQFKELCITTLKSFICRDDLFVMTEEVVFDAVITWVKASQENRLDFLPELLEYVRMPLLPPEFLTSRVSSERLVEGSPFSGSLITGINKSLKLWLTEKSDELHHMTARERFCKEKHHLKCLKVAGCGLYALCVNRTSSLFVSYYDSVNKSWALLYNVPEDTLWHVQFVICTEKSLYFLSDNNIYKLDLATLEFTDIECDGDVYLEAGIAYYKNVVYLFGGHDMPHKVQTLDLYSGGTTEIGNLVIKRLFASVACLENSVFIIGGKVPSGYTLKSVEKFNLETRESREVSPMLNIKIQCTCASLNGKIYVCNGEPQPDNEMSSFPKLYPEVYDPETDQWTCITEMHIKGYLCLIPYDGQLQVFGNVPERDCFQVKTYDSKRDQWKSEEVAFSDLEFCRIRVAVLTNSAAWPTIFPVLG